VSRFRWQALSLWVGGLSLVPIQLLWLASHGPTGFDERNVVLGLTQQDFERWSLFPLLLIVWGLMGLHQYQSDGYGRLGRIGYRLTITGYGLLLFGVVWRFVLFDPFEHPLHAVGFFAWLLGLVVVVVGWIVWGIASYRAKSLPPWALPVPFLIVAGWIAAIVFGDALYEAISIKDAVAFQVFSAIGVLVLGLVLWQADDVTKES
jgi:hypothetical protein